MNQFSQEFKKAMQDAGLTQFDVGKLLNESQSAVSYYLSRSSITLRSMEKLCNAAGFKLTITVTKR